MPTLFVEPFGGLAGDMFLAALLDLRRPELGLDDLRELADRLVPGEARLEIEEVRRRGLRGRCLTVRTPESPGSKGGAPHRHLPDLLALLEGARVSPEVRSRASACLRRIAEAEARVHDLPVEDIHFHEVGAVDTLIDVVGVFHALERLGVERVHAGTPYVGGGTVHCAHGELPVPAPATAEILRAWVLRHGPGGERVTPTGAALLAELVDEPGAPDELRSDAIGYGAGSRDPGEGPPNLVRVCFDAREASGSRERGADPVLLVEFLLDDATGEEVGFLLGELRAAGALEVWTSPVHMKKDRPGVMVSLLVEEAGRAVVEHVAFDQSPTLGVRWAPWRRTTLSRDELVVPVRGDRVRVKRRFRPGVRLEPFDLSPEHDDVARLAREHGVSLRSIEEEARSEAWRQSEEGA